MLTNFGRPGRALVICALAIAPGLVWYLASRIVSLRSAASTAALTDRTHSPETQPPRSYSTSFPLAENPVSEAGNWINGRVDGLDWADVRSTPGFAYGTESGTVRFADSTALLRGAWGPNQTVEATVRTRNPNDDISEEVELRLRSSLSPHRATGYEVNFRCSKTRAAYTQIVRWNGRLGNFTELSTARGSRFGVADGDVVKATIAGNVITSYINGIEVLRATDTVYQAGSPGLGFYLQFATGLNADFGFTKFAAADERLTAGHQGLAPHMWLTAGLLSEPSGLSHALLFSR